MNITVVEDPKIFLAKQSIKLDIPSICWTKALTNNPTRGNSVANLYFFMQ
jgi:hypothetical protein